MNSQRIVSIIVAAMVAMTGLQTTVLAKTKEKKPADEDSVYSWGPWEVLVSPAAGPQAQVPNAVLGGELAPPGFGAGDAGQFTPTLIVSLPVPPPPGTQPPPLPTGPCDAGAGCSYGLIDRKTVTTQGEVTLETSSIGPQSAGVTLSSIPLEDGEYTGMVDLTVSSNTAIPLELMISDQYFRSGVSGKWKTSESTVIPLSGGGLSVITKVINGVTLDVGGVPFAYGNSNIHTRSFASPISPLVTDDRTAGFIYGTTTIPDELESLNAGNVQATYEGFTLRDLNPVVINVDFGAGTWNGSWNGGTDSTVMAVVDSNGVTNLSGGVGFDASGDISGANIVSTDISAADATAISGTVDGSFFGGDAGVLAGAANVDKTTADYSGNYQDLYVTSDPAKVSVLPKP